MTLPIPNCYRLANGRLYGGEYPGSLDPAEARRKIGALLDAGVTVFMDLTAPADGMAPYDEILADEAVARGIAAEHVSMPVPDMGVASPALMHRILDVIDARVGGTLGLRPLPGRRVGQPACDWHHRCRIDRHANLRRIWPRLHPYG